MATRDPRLNVLAMQRFGLGLRPGDLARIGDDARDLLLDEVRRRVVPEPIGLEFVGQSQIGSAFYAFEDQEKAEREAKRSVSLIGAAQAAPGMEGAQAGQQATAMPMASSPPAAAPAVKPEPPPLPLPQKIYRDEVTARLRAGLEPLGGYGERLAQFWSNHFCVSVSQGNFVRVLAGAYEREAIRPHVFGRFEDMLLAAESHPAMLIYLDNQQSIGPNSPAGKRRGRGLNENLAREIMELHTLGVSGGYAQEDVTNLARIITGWTVAGRDGNLGFPGAFAFNAGVHEPGTHPLLGKGYAQGGAQQGRLALIDLAHHPATARYLAFKLAHHFVADEPPPTLVAKLAETYRRTEGDLAAVSAALVEAEEAWGADAVKIRSPQEFLLAAARALGRKPDFGQIAGPLATMGQPLWQPSGPNGFPDTTAAWATSEGVKTRIDVAANWARQAAGATVDPRAVTEAVLGPLASPETKQAVARAESKPQALALLLMSPEFQRR